MTQPDWARAGVGQMSGKIGPLGDPTRWGASILQRVPFTGPGPFTIVSQQIIAVACQDGYARNWSLAGTLGAPAGFWAFPESPGANTWSAFATITMGVGQNSLVHNINLRACVNADAPFYGDSPPSTWNAPPFTTPAGQLRNRPFIVPGAIVANQISILITQIVEYTLPPLPDGDAILTTIQIAPIMAGTGL